MMKKIIVLFLFMSLSTCTDVNKKNNGNKENKITETEKNIGPIEAKKINELLLNASKYNNITEVKRLLKQGANINAQQDNRYKNSSLHYAIKNNNIELASFLLKKGANVNAKGKYDRTPLHYAAKNDELALVELLVAHGADVNAKDSKYHRTILSTVSELGKLDMVAYLLKKNASVSIYDNVNNSPLHYAISRKRKKTAKLLLDAGADRYLEGQDKVTPIELAKKLGLKGIFPASVPLQK